MTSNELCRVHKPLRPLVRLYPDTEELQPLFQSDEDELPMPRDSVPVQMPMPAVMLPQQQHTEGNVASTAASQCLSVSAPTMATANTDAQQMDTGKPEAESEAPRAVVAEAAAIAAALPAQAASSQPAIVHCLRPRCPALRSETVRNRSAKCLPDKIGLTSQTQ